VVEKTTRKHLLAEEGGERLGEEGESRETVGAAVGPLRAGQKETRREDILIISLPSSLP